MARSCSLMGAAVPYATQLIGYTCNCLSKQKVSKGRVFAIQLSSIMRVALVTNLYLSLFGHTGMTAAPVDSCVGGSVPKVFLALGKIVSFDGIVVCHNVVVWGGAPGNTSF